MPRAYSLDLRERVVGLVASGEPCRAVAELFDVSVASVVKWSQRARATGSAAAKPMGGKRPYLLEGERDWLLARLAEKPDLTLHALLAELGDRGVVVSCDTLWRFLKRQGISFKKTVFDPRPRFHSGPRRRGLVVLVFDRMARRLVGASRDRNRCDSGHRACTAHGRYRVVCKQPPQVRTTDVVGAWRGLRISCASYYKGPVDRRG